MQWKQFVLLPLVLGGSIWSIIGLKNRRFRQALEDMAPDLKKLLVESSEPMTALIPARFHENQVTLPLLHYSVLTEAASTGNNITGPRRFDTHLIGGENDCILPASMRHQIMLNIYGKDVYFAGVKVKEIVVASNGRGCVAILDGHLGVPGFGTEALNENSLLPEILTVLQKHILKHNLKWETGLPHPLTILAPRRNIFWTNLSARLSPHTLEAILLAHVTVSGQCYSMDMQHGQKLMSLTKGLEFEISRPEVEDGISINGRKMMQFDAAVKYGVVHVVERPLFGGKELVKLLTLKHNPLNTTPSTFDIFIGDVPDPTTLLDIDEGLDLGEEAIGPPLGPFGCPFNSNGDPPDDQLSIPARPAPQNTPGPNSSIKPKPDQKPSTVSFSKSKKSKSKPSSTPQDTNAEISKKVNSNESDGILKGIVISVLALIGMGGIACAAYLIHKSRRPPFAHHRVHSSL